MNFLKQASKILLGVAGMIGGLVLLIYAAITGGTILEIVDKLFFAWMAFTIGISSFISLYGRSFSWRFFVNVAVLVLGIALVFVSVIGIAFVYGKPFLETPIADRIAFFSLFPAINFIILSAQSIHSPKISAFYRKVIVILGIVVGSVMQLFFMTIIELIPDWLGWIIIIGLIGGFLYWFIKAEGKQNTRKSKFK